MLEFKLCYRLFQTENTYISPQLLDFNKPEYSWDNNDSDSAMNMTLCPKEEDVECKKKPYNGVNVLNLINNIGDQNKPIASSKKSKKTPSRKMIAKEY